MREFYLLNGSGQMYSLMDVKHWLYEPTKLGAKFQSKYEQIDSDFIRTERIAKPDDITGKVMFTSNQYGEYFNFMEFLAVEPLTLMYRSNAMYKVSVDLKEIEKSEIEDGRLLCELKLKRLSRWYKEITIYNDGNVDIGKTYDHTYPFTYTDMEPETAIIQSDSGYNSPTKITIFGPCINPEWVQYLNNEVISSGKINATIRSGRKAVIDCTKIPYSIKELDSDNLVTNDLYQLSDFETQRFVFCKFGKNRIVVDHEGTNTLRIAVEARIEYETV